MSVHELSRADARRIAVRAQLLDRPRPKDLFAVLDRLTLIQHDQTATVAPNADLVLWSRLGSAYAPAELEAALAGRALVELHGFIRPGEDLALYRADMAAWPGQGDVPHWRTANAEWVQTNDACRRDILARLEESGPLVSGEIPDTCVQPWRSSGWNNDRNVILLLELMVSRGEVAVSGRRGRDKLWDLADRVYPASKAVPAEEARQTRDELRLRSLGLVRDRAVDYQVEPTHVGEAGEPAVVAGVKGKWRVDPAQLGQRFSGRTALISPLDRLVYDRKRMVDLFEFDYQLEMYKPAAKRRWGYFALPILSGDRLVGKLDATADRKAGVLRVHAVHQDEPFSEAVLDAVNAEIDDLAAWLDLDRQGD